MKTLKRRTKVKSVKEVLAVLGNNRETLERLKVESLALFGSFARGEQGASSDLDILVEFSGPADYFLFIELKDFLASVLGRKIDLATRKSIRPEYLPQVEREQVRVA